MELGILLSTSWHKPTWALQPSHPVQETHCRNNCQSIPDIRLNNWDPPKYSVVGFFHTQLGLVSLFITA